MTRETRRPGRTDELRVGSEFRYDAGRWARIGAPEVILGEGKSPAQLLRLLEALHRSGRGALVSRPTTAQRTRLVVARREGLPVLLLAGGRLARLTGPVADLSPVGPVALLTAGTSDIPIAEEARHVLKSVGVAVVTAYDVGVAGLHRLQRALRSMERKRPRVYLVFAGREGALPTVVAGLVRAPVVGVPVSIGYGRGGRGEAALNAMLQSCAPIAVVNIDAGVPAALFALQLLAGNRR
ncbi:MAG: nickel pincer cofactor biosynthesis protein LarB [Thermoplasmata archaeon]|nr:nickel pincer cofactor biosynthesis protein LarB [Thermoplasmata archaeon]